MIKVEITRGIHWNGEHRDPGDVIEVKESDASWLFGRGKAKPFDDRAPVVNRAVEIPTTEQPKLTKRTWKKSSESSQS
jgi:hypothetical protein